MRLHVHTGPDAQTHTIPDADDESTIADHIHLEDEFLVFKVDDEGPELVLTARLSEVFDGPLGRVATHPGRQITVVVDYVGSAATLTVSPGTRLGAIRDQAIAQLSIDAASAADLGLRTPGGTEDLPLDKPIASIAKGANHVDLELVALVRPQG